MDAKRQIVDANNLLESI